MVVIHPDSVALAIIFDDGVRKRTVDSDVVLPGTILITFASEVVG